MDLAIRKSALMAIGWEFRKDYGPYAVWGAYMPNGQVYFVEFSLDRVMQSCPAVESSVDAARENFRLDEGHYFQMDDRVNGPDMDKEKCLVAIVDINSSMERVKVDNPATAGQMLNAIKFNKPIVEVAHESMAMAMCIAYIKYHALIKSVRIESDGTH